MQSFHRSDLIVGPVIRDIDLRARQEDILVWPPTRAAANTLKFCAAALW